MITQGFGEIITDILTTNPTISSIPSASAILDTSNYTFYAISLGKDSTSYLVNAHNPSGSTIATSASPILPALNVPVSANNGHVLSIRYNTASPSSYHSSSTQIYFKEDYSGIQQYPSIYDLKLEKTSKTTLEKFYNLYELLIQLGVTNNSLKDFGHYKNIILDGTTVPDGSLAQTLQIPVNFSALWNCIGSYPPSGNNSIYGLYTSAGALITSGNLSGVFNSQGVVDINGFIKINPTINVTSPSSGPMLATSGQLSSLPAVYIKVPIQMGDAAALALFGGVTQIGVWCLDLKEMLKSGLTPPYSWSNVNTNRKYKLVSKTTFWNDILVNDDVGGISGLQRLAQGTGYTSPFKGPCIVLQIKF